jgi:uncharacterized protein (TIGR00369 family)
MTGMTVDEINAFLAQGFPGREGGPVAEYADGRLARCRIRYDARQLRPGGTLSGPTMMSLADTAVYVLIFSAIGFSPLSVTTNLSINFLRKPKPADLIAEARTLKQGKALFVADVTIRSDGEEAPVAHAVVTYSIPPKKETGA